MVITHSPAYTALEVAEAAHVSGKGFAKTVIVKVNGQLAMAVVPATHKVNIEFLKNMCGTSNVVLAMEEEFEDAFDDCVVGAMPPFGPLYGMNVYVAEQLFNCRDITFTAGDHTCLIRMAYSDFELLVHPKVMELAT